MNFNEQNYRKVLETIEANPSCWKQDSWHCGTKHCFAGWAQVLDGKTPNDAVVRRDARIFLGLSFADANYLFAPSRTMQDFRDFLTRDDAGYNRAGYDRYGYNRAGYDRDGYDRDGYNRAGYDRDGYNRAGYDRDGYDRDGYDPDGLNANNEPRS